MFNFLFSIFTVFIILSSSQVNGYAIDDILDTSSSQRSISSTASCGENPVSGQQGYNPFKTLDKLCSVEQTPIKPFGQNAPTIVEKPNPILVGTVFLLLVGTVFLFTLSVNKLAKHQKYFLKKLK